MRTVNRAHHGVDRDGNTVRLLDRQVHWVRFLLGERDEIGARAYVEAGRAAGKSTALASAAAIDRHVRTCPVRRRVDLLAPCECE